MSLTAQNPRLARTASEPCVISSMQSRPDLKCGFSSNRRAEDSVASQTTSRPDPKSFPKTQLGCLTLSPDAAPDRTFLLFDLNPNAECIVDNRVKPEQRYNLPDKPNLADPDAKPAIPNLPLDLLDEWVKYFKADLKSAGLTD